MALVDAVRRVPAASGDLTQADRKRFSELLSRALAEEVAAGLRRSGFPNTKPLIGGPSEKEFQGGLGPKRVDVSYSDERHGLLLAVSIKTISFPPFGKNLKNRFSDLCAEAITLHMRFPYSVICGLFAFPISASEDRVKGVSTFWRALRLFNSITGRLDHSGANEKYELFALMLYDPADTQREGALSLYDVTTKMPMSEVEYFHRIRELFEQRNPHLLLQDIDSLPEP